jgi:hypothetical protein
MTNPNKKLEKTKEGKVIVKPNEPATPEQPAQPPTKEPEPQQTEFEVKFDRWNCILFRKQVRESLQKISGIKPESTLILKVVPDGMVLTPQKPKA